MTESDMCAGFVWLAEEVMGGRQWAVATAHVCLFTCGTLKDVNCVAQRNIIMCLWWFGVGAGQMRGVGRSVGCVIIYLIECVARALGWTVPPSVQALRPVRLFEFARNYVSRVICGR